MINDLFKIFRSWKNRKVFLVINISGLAIGLSVSILLLLFVSNEWSFDRHFENCDRIVQLNTAWTENGQQNLSPICTRSAYTDIPQKVPGIESATQIYRGWQVEVTRKPDRFQKVNLLYADPEFFRVFKMKFRKGTPETALSNVTSAVITDKQAEIIFGGKDPVGENISIEGNEYTISAVVERLPQNTHFTFDVLLPMSSLKILNQLGGLEFFTYYLLRKDADRDQTCKSIVNTYVSDLNVRFSAFAANSKLGAELVKLTDIHLFSKAQFGLSNTGSIKSVLVMLGLALLVLLLAIANFVNLFVVQGSSRAVEVGIRKASGGSVRDIALQFFSEASVIVITSFVLGIILAVLLMKPFSALIGKPVVADQLCNLRFIICIIILVITTIILSASYPAFYISSFKPVEIIRKTVKTTKQRFYRTIVVFQSVLTIILITFIFVINRQIAFMRDIPSGYNPENVMVVYQVNEQIMNHYEALRESLGKVAGIEAVSSSHHVVGGGTSGQGIYRYGDSEKNYKTINEYRILPGLCELMEFRLADGRFFADNDHQNAKSVVLNEAAVKMLDLHGSAVGQKVVMFDEPMEIIGVVKNFYYDSPASTIKPIALTCYSREPKNIYIRFNKTINKAKAIGMVLPVFRQFDADFALNPSWCDDIYDSKFNSERMFSKVILASTFLSLIVALLGLFAVHSFMAERRTKEIGIRKVMGSTSFAVVSMLSVNIIEWVGLAGLIGMPVAFWISMRWLQGYANRMHLGLALILVPVIIQVLMALFVTIAISMKASFSNPVKALRYE